MGAPEESPAASMDAHRLAQDPQILIVTMTGRIDRADATWFGDQVDALLRARGTSVVVCDVGGLVRPDAVAVDVVCRIRLAARRHASRVVLRNASTELLDLLGLTGLCRVLAAAPRSDLQAKRQPKQREQPRRVEEEGDPADPIA